MPWDSPGILRTLTVLFYGPGDPIAPGVRRRDRIDGLGRVSLHDGEWMASQPVLQGAKVCGPCAAAMRARRLRAP